MIIENLFPTKILLEPLASPTSLKKVLRELKIEAMQIAKMDEDGQTWSKKNYPFGFTSYASQCYLHKTSSTFENLKALIDKKVTKYRKALHWDLDGGALEMTTCWVNLMPLSCYHGFHLHPYSVISGTFYVDVPRGSGCFKIEDPRISNFMRSPCRLSKSPQVEQNYFKVEPKPGNLVLFESWLKHEVPAHQGDGIRISVSFNYDWIC